MEVAKIKITGTDAVVSELKDITSGMIGATVSIEYDDTWADLNKQVVFKGPFKPVNADGNTIPPEVLRLSGFELKVGVYGYTDDDSYAIPTIWASVGMIQAGADPEGDESAAPTLPVWARMQNQIGNLDDLKTKAKTDLVAAINELQAAGVDETEIQRIIGEYLKENEIGGKADLAVNDPDAPGYVANRTHWKEVAQEPLDIQWDGDLSLFPYIEVNGYIIAKVSDRPLSHEEALKCAIIVSFAGKTATALPGEAECGEVSGMVFVTEPFTSLMCYSILDAELASNAIGVNLETGIYFLMTGEHAYVSRLFSDEVMVDKDVYHGIDKRYLPAPLQFPTVTAADAGKTLRFVVDTNGNWVPEIVEAT